ADALEGDAVQLVVGAELDAGEFHTHVAQDARVVGRIVAAVDAGITFTDADAAREVERRATVDDETAPVAAAAAANGLIGGHHDGLFPRAVSDDLRATLDDERAARGCLANDPRSRFDDEPRGFGDEHGTAQHPVGVLREDNVLGDPAAHD